MKNAIVCNMTSLPSNQHEASNNTKLFCSPQMA
jgi:hypothetical protein